MPEDLGDEGTAEGVDTIARHTFNKARQPQAMPELSYHQPNQTSQQAHAPSYPQPTPTKELLAEEQAGLEPKGSVLPVKCAF